MNPTIPNLQKSIALAVLWCVVPIVLAILALCIWLLLYVNPDLGQAAGVAITVGVVCVLAGSIALLTIGG